MFLKNEKLDSNQSKIVLGMIMVKQDHSFDSERFKDDFKENFDYTIKDASFENSVITFKVDGNLVAIAQMPVPIPYGDIETVAAYAYNWNDAARDLQFHKSHLIVSILGDGKNQIKSYKILTQVISSLLRTTESLGVYMGNQSLLIPKNDYLHESGLMSEDYLPLNLWIYFGLKVLGKHKSGYTFGLKEFNKTEMEIIDSSKKIEDIRGFLFNMTHYVLDHGVTFKDGQTCGLSEKERILITLSKGKFVDGDTLKLAY